MRRSRMFASGLILAVAAAGPLSGQETTLETTKVVSQTLDKTVSIPGDLIAYQSVSVHARVAGFVESVSVDRGSWVTRGQSLAKLTAPELVAQRLEAEAKVQAMRAQQLEAEAKAISAESTHDRLVAAAKTPGVVAGNDVEIAAKTRDAARAHADAVRSGAAAAEAALGTVRELEKYLDIRAPFDGVITERNVHRGSLVGPSGSPMLRIEQLSRLRLVVPVPENYVGGIKKGMPVNFKVSAFPDQGFQGVIARPSYSLDVRTRSMLVELDVPNPKSVLSPGMFADVQWPVSRAQASLFVPPSAVVRTTERQFVVRIRNGVADWVDVRRGATSGALLEVFGDLREGDVIVRRGNDEIRPGSKVTQKAGR